MLKWCIFSDKFGDFGTPSSKGKTNHDKNLSKMFCGLTNLEFITFEKWYVTNNAWVIYHHKHSDKH